MAWPSGNGVGHNQCAPNSPKPSSIQLRSLSTIFKPGIEREQALADISRSALCCHSNETCAPITNLPNSAQLEGTPYIRDRVVVWKCGEGQTDTQTVLAW